MNAIFPWFKVTLIFWIFLSQGWLCFGIGPCGLDDKIAAKMLNDCAERNTAVLSRKASKKSINRFKEYCITTFKGTDKFPIAFFSYIPANEFGEKGSWSLENINNSRKHRSQRIFSWLKKNYIPTKEVSFFYLAVEAYKEGWNMDQKIQSDLFTLLDSVPLLISCNHPDLPWTKKAILIPDDFILADKFSQDIENLLGSRVYSSIDEMSEGLEKGLVPFSERISNVYFRGALTGPKLPFTLDNMKLNPRHYIMTLLDDYFYLDVKPTHFLDKRPGSGIEFIRKNFYHLKSPRVDFFEHAKNKYLLSMDGFGAAWSRMQLIMATGSVLFLNAQCEQYFYQLMEPGKTYIVINRDFSNLDDEYRRLEADPNRAEKIGNRGKAFVQKFFTKTAIDAYLWLVLNKIESYTSVY